jgi:antitoxin MazE
MVTELSKFLDDSWLKKEVPSFYKLEDYYKVRSGGGFWDRMRLIHSCRYMFLKGMFDQEFWEVIKFRQPSEADSITSKFRTDEIYLE